MTKLNINEEFVVTLNGKDYVTYNGLVDMAHQIGLKSIETEMLQIPSKENGYMAIFKAVVTDKEDRVFEGYGDASPKSVTGLLVPHLIRMAETRSKARALRDLTNVGMTAFEELGDDDINSPNNRGKQQARQTQKRPAQANTAQCKGCGANISEKVKQFSINKYKKPLCMDCQQKIKQA